jgi:hypothetical protein
LELYRFYTDTIILEHVLELFSTQVGAGGHEQRQCHSGSPTHPRAVLFDVALHRRTAFVFIPVYQAVVCMLCGIPSHPKSADYTSNSSHRVRVVPPPPYYDPLRLHRFS